MRYLLHGFGQFHATHHIGPHTWEHFDLLWIYSGKVTIQVGRSPVMELTGGDGVLIYPGTPMQGRALTRTAFASAQHFDFGNDPGLPGALKKLRGKKSGYRVFRGFSHSPVIGDIERAIQMASEPDTKANRELRRFNLAMILQQLETIAPDAGSETLGRKSLAAWRREFQQKPLLKATVAELAKRVGLSIEQLRGRLAGHGNNPRRFLLEIRMEHARHLLTGSEVPIKVIAEETGYADVVAFHRAFANYFSETPALYRERHRQLFTG